MYAMLIVLSLAESALESEAGGEKLFVADLSEGLYWTRHNCCGLVAAYVVCKRVGRGDSLAQMARELPVGENGTSLADLMLLLRKKGFECSAVELSADELARQLKTDETCRAIVLLSPEHWVAVERALDNRFCIYDYPKWSWLTTEEFSARYQGRALFLRHLGAGNFGPMTRVVRANAAAIGWTFVVCMASTALAALGVRKGRRASLRRPAAV